MLGTRGPSTGTSSLREPASPEVGPWACRWRVRSVSILRTRRGAFAAERGTQHSEVVSDTYDVLVIGAGPAGTSAAVRAAELGARVAVLEAQADRRNLREHRLRADPRAGQDGAPHPRGPDRGRVRHHGGGADDRLGHHGRARALHRRPGARGEGRAGPVPGRGGRPGAGGACAVRRRPRGGARGHRPQGARRVGDPVRRRTLEAAARARRRAGDAARAGARPAEAAAARSP